MKWLLPDVIAPVALYHQTKHIMNTFFINVWPVFTSSHVSPASLNQATSASAIYTFKQVKWRCLLYGSVRNSAG
jgi:hypothetical protein